MECPKCGSQSRILKVFKSSPVMIVRVRQCKHCDTTFSTSELYSTVCPGSSEWEVSGNPQVSICKACGYRGQWTRFCPDCGKLMIS